jgi:acyl carrier protein
VNDAELRAAVLACLVQVAPDIEVSAIDPRADLAEQLDLDSMDFLNVVVALHERTGIDIPERDYPKLDTLDRAVAYLAAAQS